MLNLDSVCTTCHVRNGDRGGGAGNILAQVGDPVVASLCAAVEVDVDWGAISCPGQGKLLTRGDVVEGGVGKLDGGGEEGHEGRGHKGDETDGKMHCQSA